MDTPATPPPATPPPGAAPPACYRHADRSTRLSCSSCGRPVCVDCVRPSAVGQKCPECAAPEGRSKVISADDIRGRSALDGAPVTIGILAVTVLIGVLSFLAPGAVAELRQNLVHDVRLVDAGQWYRVVTAALLHSASFYLHLIFNMWALYVFGPPLERQAGSAPFALLYVATAAAGGAAFQLLNDAGGAVGASGAIFGLFGAWTAAAYLNRHTAAGRANLNSLLPLVAINLALPLFIRGIAWEAHVGGLIAGVIISAVWLRLPGSAAARSGVAAAVLVLSLLAVIL